MTEDLTNNDLLRSTLQDWLYTYFALSMCNEPIAFYKPRANGKGSYHKSDESLSVAHIERHLYYGEPIGLYVMDAKTDGFVKCAVIDIDNKDKSKSLDEILKVAESCTKLLEQRLLLPWPCLSGSGHGVHLWLLWKDFQPANHVRSILKEVVKELDTKLHIDIFPAQDSLNGGLGNLVALPLARGSKPIDQILWKPKEVGLSKTASDYVGNIAFSAPVVRPRVLKKDSPNSSGYETDQVTWASADQLFLDAEKGIGPDSWGKPDPELLKEALFFIPPDDYGIWLRVGLALKSSVDQRLLEEDEAKLLWDLWSEQSQKFDSRSQDYNWSRFRSKVGPYAVTLGTIWWLAKEYGWKYNDYKDDSTYQNKIEDLAELQSSNELDKQMGSDHGKLSNETPHMSDSFSAHKEAPSDAAYHENYLDDQLWRKNIGGQEICEVNKRHFIALDGGKLNVFREDWDSVLRRHRLTRMSASDFRTYYQNRQVVTKTTRQGRVITKPLGEYWIESPHRRQYQEIVLRPEGAPASSYNLWRGWAVEPSPDGDWSLLKEHIYHNICRGVDFVYDYVLNWCAFAVQRPETPAGTSIVLRGDRGTGKSSFVRAIGELFGQHFLQVTNSKSVTGSFNSHLRDCIFLFADEAVWGGDRREESVLKGLVTEPMLPIEGKGRDLVMCRNMVHLVISTNNEWAVPAGMDERRFCVLHVGNEKKQNAQFFRMMQRQLQNGGHARLLYDLLNRDLKSFDVHAVPQTKELVNQKILSLEPWALWWFECLQRGNLYDGHLDWDREFCEVSAVYKSYVEFCKEAGYRNPGAQEHLFKNIGSLVPGGQIVRIRKAVMGYVIDQKTGANVQRLVKKTLLDLPRLSACRKHFDQLVKGQINWDDEDIRKEELVMKSDIENCGIVIDGKLVKATETSSNDKEDPDSSDDETLDF